MKSSKSKCVCVCAVTLFRGVDVSQHAVHFTELYIVSFSIEGLTLVYPSSRIPRAYAHVKNHKYERPMPKESTDDYSVWMILYKSCRISVLVRPARKADTLTVGSRVGLLVTGDGRGDLIVPLHQHHTLPSTE
jgi:hypothetical protein